jgi:hypothetical protein
MAVKLKPRDQIVERLAGDPLRLRQTAFEPYFGIAHGNEGRLYSDFPPRPHVQHPIILQSHVYPILGLMARDEIPAHPLFISLLKGGYGV